jgi:O-antigen/teichoic acid export membrane protein
MPTSSSNISSNIDRNKRIASNTIVLFVRMFVLMIINLYTVRIVLNRLGDIDYGIYNAVAGVVTATAFISGVLALSIQRFYSIALGKGDYITLHKIFSASINIVIGVTIVLLIIFETVGIWFIKSHMTIPIDRLEPAIVLFQFALFTFFLSIIQIPYTAAVFTHEDMGIYALISTIECLGRLLVALLIGICFIDNLIFYGLGLFFVSIIISGIYIYIARRRYDECHYHVVNDFKLHKQILTFSGWTTFGSVSNTLMIQGSTILINIYFGPLINVAFGIALNINNAFMTLTNSMVLPFRPQMIKAYAQKNYGYINSLFSISNKFIFYILIAVAAPIISEMNLILKLWLGNVSHDTLIFSQFIIIYIICISIHNPITTIIHASGHIKEYHLPVESITLLCLPITLLLFHWKCPAYYIFFSMIGVVILAHIVRLICLRIYYKPFSIVNYFKLFIVRAIIISIIGGIITYLLHSQIVNTGLRTISVATISPISILTLTYCFGIDHNERLTINKYTNTFIKKIICHK